MSSKPGFAPNAQRQEKYTFTAGREVAQFYAEHPERLGTSTSSTRSAEGTSIRTAARPAAEHRAHAEKYYIPDYIAAATRLA